MIVKIMIGIGIALVVSAVLLPVIRFCAGGNRIRDYRDESGNAVPGSLSEKTIVELNGVRNGFFINSRDVSNPVLLLVSSGPGTDDYFLTERFPDMRIDELFTLVYWDYRGMGMVYDPKIDPESITTDVLIDDAKAVTEYLMKRFGKEKIYIMGFSGGTKIAARAAQKFPELYHAYIGMAQVVTDSSENDTLMYEFMRSVFETRGDKARLRRLESAVHRDKDGLHCNDWDAYVMLLHEAGGGTTRDETEFWGIDVPIMMAHCYTAKEKIDYIRGLKMYRATAFAKEHKGVDFRESVNAFAVPVYFLSGEYDYNTPHPLVRDYCGKLTAPDKRFYLIPDAAHSPLWENPADSRAAMEEILKRTALSRRA